MTPNNNNAVGGWTGYPKMRKCSVPYSEMLSLPPPTVQRRTSRKIEQKKPFTLAIISFFRASVDSIARARPSPVHALILVRLLFLPVRVFFFCTVSRAVYTLQSSVDAMQTKSLIRDDAGYKFT